MHVEDRPRTLNPASTPSSPNRMLATVGFGINFWAWALISPLGPTFGTELRLSSFQQALLVAVPVVVGSLGRIPVGALTDRYGPRVLCTLVTALTVLPVLLVGLAGSSYGRLLLGGFFLGIGGTAFAVGVPMVNSWFPPARRGAALGIFGVGMVGTAVSAFTTVRQAEHFGRGAPFVLVAVLLVVFAVVSARLVRSPAGRVPAEGSFVARTVATARLPSTVQLSALYAVGFGAGRGRDQRGDGILVYRRRTVGPVFSATTRMDKVMHLVLATVITPGLANTVLATFVGGHDYRLGVSVWFRGIFGLQPHPELMGQAPIGFQAHGLAALALFARWPLTRLVHVFSAPVGYLWRPYVVYRSKDVPLGARAERPGWEHVQIPTEHGHR